MRIIELVLQERTAGQTETRHRFLIPEILTFEEARAVIHTAAETKHAALQKLRSPRYTVASCTAALQEIQP